MKLTAAALTLATAVVTVPLAVAGGAGADPGRSTTAAEPDQRLADLRVLLVNDDSAQGRDTALGRDGKGLYELRRALCAEGADVAVVAPWAQQSGAGGRITTPSTGGRPVTVQPVTPPAAFADDCADAGSAGPVYGVCLGADPCTEESESASPADAATVGLTRLVPDTLWREGPDVVLSGVNFGQNNGELVNHSGTVGAAVTAHELGAPAIAVSAEFTFADPRGVPFADAADFAVETLSRVRDRDLLTPSLALNLNYPYVEDGAQAGPPAYTRIGTSSDLTLDYRGEVTAEGGTYDLHWGGPSAETRDRADVTAMRDNRPSVTPLDGDWTGGRSDRALESLVRTW